MPVYMAVRIIAHRSGPRPAINWIAGTQEGAMPRSEFLCEKCKKPFDLVLTIAEREKATPKCPTCKGTKVVPQYGGFMAQTSKKS
jgi:putative FmdB family regulatory protein